MFDYRLFFPGSTLDQGRPSRGRITVGHGVPQRIYQLPSARRPERAVARR